jgi:hypothetical protein
MVLTAGDVLNTIRKSGDSSLSNMYSTAVTASVLNKQTSALTQKEINAVNSVLNKSSSSKSSSSSKEQVNNDTDKTYEMLQSIKENTALNIKELSETLIQQNQSLIEKINTTPVNTDIKTFDYKNVLYAGVIAGAVYLLTK